MKSKFFLLSLAVIGVAGTANAQLYGVSNGFGTPADNRIYQINPGNADLSNIQQITMSGFTVQNALALAAQPGTGTLYGVVQTGAGVANRRLVRINPNTGLATDVGSLGRGFSSIAFEASGRLLGVTGDGATPPETLFEISLVNATSIQLFALGNGADGETIASHPDGFLYHSSGNGTALFEKIHVPTQVITPLGQSNSEAFAMGYHSGLNQMLLSDISSQLFSVNLTNGSRTLIGSMSDQLGSSDNRGLAFVAVPEPGTMVALGLGALAMLRRRRKA
jgi:hypothetical protein